MLSVPVWRALIVLQDCDVQSDNTVTPPSSSHPTRRPLTGNRWWCKPHFKPPCSDLQFMHSKSNWGNVLRGFMYVIKKKKNIVIALFVHGLQLSAMKWNLASGCLPCLQCNCRVWIQSDFAYETLLRFTEWSTWTPFIPDWVISSMFFSSWKENGILSNFVSRKKWFWKDLSWKKN